MSSQDVKAKPAASPLDLYQPGLNPAEQEAGDCERSAATATREGIPVNLHLRNAPACQIWGQNGQVLHWCWGPTKTKQPRQH